MIEQRELGSMGRRTMSPALKWTLAIVGLLGGNVLAMTVLITAAHRGPSRVIPAYYERATHYDRVLDQAARNRQLGWKVEVAAHAAVLSVRVRDRVGAPLSGARVRVDGNQRVHDQPLASALVETAPGHYQGRVAGSGWVDLSIAIEWAADRFVHEISVEVR